MSSTSLQLTSGSRSLNTSPVQSVYEPWPYQQWAWPQPYVYPTTTIYAPSTGDEYANEVEVIQNDHDATLHFYRSSGPKKGRTHIKTVTIPLSVLEWLQGKE